HADLALHFRKNAQALLHPQAAKRLRRAAVGLVVRGLEDERHGERGAGLLEPPGHVDLQLLGLDHARARNEEQRPVQPDLESAELHDQATSCGRARAGSPRVSRAWASAASI